MFDNFKLGKRKIMASVELVLGGDMKVANVQV